MKKYILVFLLAACAAFSACGADADAFLPFPEQDTVVSESKEPVVLTEEQQIVMNAVKRKRTSEYFGDVAFMSLHNAGFDIDVQNQRLGENDFTLLYDLKFTNKTSGEVFVFEKLTASLKYTMEDLAMSLNNLWIEGTAAGMCGDEIYIADLDRIRFFNADTFERSATSVFFENGNSSTVTFYNVLKDGDTYIIACRSGGEHVILMTTGHGGVYKFDMNLKDDTSYIPFSLNMSLRENYPAHILFGDSYCYDSDQQALYYISDRIKGENGGETFYFERWRSLSTTGEDRYQLTGYKDGVASFDMFDAPDVNPVFGINQQTGEFGTNVTMEFANGNRNVIIYCPDSQASLTLDRETGSSTVKYNPDARQINLNNPVRSRDQRYSIYRGASAGGGDYWVYQMILQDSDTSNKENMYRYIDVIGGMYGGGEDIGFFSNNDIYIFSHTEFKTYKAGMPSQEPEFVLSKNFPLGVIETNGVYARYLFAARRDPETREYIVLYADFPEFDYIGDLAVDTNGMVMPVTYKVGLLDADGVLQHTIDTGCNVWWDTFGFKTVNMVKPNANTLRFTVSRKDEIVNETVVHLDTEKTDKLFERKWVAAEDAETEQTESSSTKTESSTTEQPDSSSADSSSTDNISSDSSSDGQTEN